MKGPRNSDTSIAMSTSSAQILVSKHHSSVKGTMLLREMGDSGAEKGKIQHEPGASCARK